MIILHTDQGYIPSYLILMILSMGAFGIMGGGLVAPGLPAIGEAFDTPEQHLGLILSVYTLSAALSLPLIGYFIDVIGRRKVLLACLVIDGISGLGIVFAPSFGVLIFLRFIQGIGIAGLIPVAMTIIGDLFSGKKKLQIVGYFTGIISLGAAVVPFLGGMLASIDWRFIFGLYGVSLLMAIFFFGNLPETSPNQSPKYGFLKYLSSLFSVLKISNIRNVMYHSLVTFFLLYTLVTFLPFYLVRGHGFGEIFTGLSLSLQGFFATFLSSKAKQVAQYLKWKHRISFGFLLMALSFLLFPFWPQGSYLISISFIIYGIGMGIVSPTIYYRATELSPKELTGSVISIFNTMKFTGMTLSPLMLGFLLPFTGIEMIFIGTGIAGALWGIVTLR